MATDDVVNQAKDLMNQGEAKVQSAADQAAAGNSEAAAAESKEAGGLLAKAKALLSDERIDSVANAIKDKTPDNIDAMIDKVATKGKQLND